MADSTVTASDSNRQYKRNFKLTVFDASFNGVDLSNLHCKFVVKRSSNQTPNCADIRVYNMKDSDALRLQNTLAPSIGTTLTNNRGFVEIQGGYDSNKGVVFRGNIKQVIVGRENATDTFIDFNCGDGDLAYNNAVVNATVGGNGIEYFQTDLLNQITQPMVGLGVTLKGDQPEFMQSSLPRGKTLWGNSRDYLRLFAQTNGQTWSIQEGQIQFIPQQGYAPGESVILTSKTGMIGTPQQTIDGVNVTCLMNPLINPGQTVKIDNRSIAGYKVDLGNTKDPVNLPPPLNADGVYYVSIIEQSGDNRGVDWYSKLVCYTVKPAAAPINSVQVSYGP